MKFSNFKMKKVKKSDYCDEYNATIDVETGALWWRRYKTVEIAKESPGFWFFKDTGKFTPGHFIDNLFKVWKMNGKKINEN